MGRLAGFALAVAALLVSVPQQAGAAQRNAPEISGSAGILVDAADGRVLWEKESTVRRPPASTTKILTAMLVLERIEPEALVTISSTAEAVGEGQQGPNPPVELHLVRGERITVRQLLFGLLLESANDAAIALAEHVAGSESKFVELMNQRARKLNALDSHFVNPHGLDAPGHESTAFDLMTLAREAIKHPLFREIVRTRSYEFPGYGPRPARVIENRNQLLGTFPGAIGVKTGFTTPAGRSIVALAERGSESRIAVVLGSPEDAHPDAARILEYGFEAFERTDLIAAGRPWGHVTWADGSTAEIIPLEDVEVLTLEGEPARIVFDPGQSELVALVQPSARISVRTKLSCAGNSCEPPVPAHANPITRLWDVLAPVAKLLASIFD